MYKQSQIVLAASVCVALLAMQPAAAENPSRPFEKPLAAIQELIRAKKYDEANVKLREVRALEKATAYDTFVINEFCGNLNLQQRQYPEAYTCLQANAESGFLPAKGPRQNALAQIAYQLKNYTATVEHGVKAAELGSDDDASRLVVMQSYYLLNKSKEAGLAAQDAIARDERAGRKPDKGALLMLRQTQQKLGDPGQSRTLEKLLTHYPSPDLWTLAIASLKDQAEKLKDDRLTLQVYRLMAEVGSLKSGQQFAEMAQLAVEQGFPGETVRVLDEGIRKGVFTEQRDKERNTRLLEAAKKLVVEERQGMARIEKVAADGADGNLLVAAGASYAFNMDNPSQGLGLISQGIAKGSLKNINDAYITLGVVNYKAKNNAEALKVFDKVDKNEAYERLGKLWSLHLR